MTRRSAGRTIVCSVLLALAAAPASPAGESPSLASGERWSLAEERSGDRLCLVYTTRDAPGPGREQQYRKRHCASVPLPDRRLDPSVFLPGCSRSQGAMFLAVGPDVAKINVSKVSPKPFALRRYALRRASGRAFLLRRDLSHRGGTLTSYDAEGNRLAQVSWRPFPAPDCAPPPKQAIPG